VLNAKHHAQEAVIVAQAGRLHTITVATNMAGRGVDIVLGGNPEGLARDEVRAQGLDIGLRGGERALPVAVGKVQAAVRRRSRRYVPSVASTCSGASATRAGALTTSSGVGPGGRAIPATAGSTCHSRTS